MHRIPIMGDDLPGTMLAMLGDEFEVFPWDESADNPALKVVRGLVTYGHPHVDGRLLDRCPEVKVVSNHGVGVDHIDVAACAVRHVAVGNTPGCLDASTADMTIALLLAAARNVVIGDNFARSPEFTHYDPSNMIGREVTGSTLGIIGLGRIGRQVARRARGFDMRILYYGRSRQVAAEQTLNAEYVPLEKLLADSDFVTLNCPLTPETKGLIGAEQLAQMKRTAILVNMARGGVVDHDALYHALTNGIIASAALDVTEPEPLPRNHPLLKLSNLVIAPHLGSASDKTRLRMQQMTVENLRAGLHGDPLPYAVRAS
ncbi:MAG: D-glycerate dehydrogenase [Planctomycetales bacterium 12-60-4]|nr:MAG: D-glycerate dehydrogenase [Planctomycetales bacterium 12-60-4]